MKLFTLLPFVFAGTAIAKVETINLSRDEVTYGTKYVKSDIEKAANEALRLRNAGETVGANKYPHYYGNKDGVARATNCNGAALEEFPLTRTVPYSGDDPKTYRVAFNYIDGKPDDVRYVSSLSAGRPLVMNDFRLCAVMLHRKRDGKPTGCDWTK
ncbi:hypothetical protein AWENTII_011119 [Aspergillus wentii]